MRGLCRAKNSERRHGTGRILVTDPIVLRHIRDIGLTDVDLAEIAAWKNVSRGIADRTVDRLCRHLLRTRTAPDRQISLERHRPILADYVGTMFSGHIDHDYFRYRGSVGGIHSYIDLDPSWHWAMHETARESIDEGVRAAGGTDEELRRFQSSFSKLIQLDIALMLMATTNLCRPRVLWQGAERGWTDGPPGQPEGVTQLPVAHPEDGGSPSERLSMRVRRVRDLLGTFTLTKHGARD